MIIAHLKTQNGQGYGSERRCCEICGKMLWPEVSPIPEGHDWTDDPEVYRALPEGYQACSKVSETS